MSIQLKVSVIEIENNVSLEFFEIDDNERDEAMIIESVITKSSTVWMTIDEEEIEAKKRMLMIEVTKRVIDLKIERVVNFWRAIKRVLYI